MENASITHQELFNFLIKAKNLNMSTVSCLASNTLSTTVINNMPKYLAFSDSKFDSSFLISDHTFNNHSISVKWSNSSSVLVTFLCVPPLIGDDEIIHLLQHFGSINHTNVSHEKHKDPLAKGIHNGNRTVEVELYTDVEMPTYFWLDGTQQYPNPIRITVKHINQSPQFCNCLNIGSECLAAGNGKGCKAKKVNRCSIKDYNK